MRKLLFLAAAATVMVSCYDVKEIGNDVKDNNEPKVIGFNTISEKATRASVENLEVYHGTFSVWSTKKSNNDENAATEVVFCGDSARDLITFDATRQAPNNWTYSPYRYWDKQATFDFVAVAPNSNIIRYNNPTDVANNAGTYVTKSDAGYTLVGQNLQSNTEPADAEIKVGFVGGNGDTDLMTAGKITRNGAAAISDVNLEFKHILAKLNIAIAKDPTFDNVKVLIDTVYVLGLDDNGTYIETSSTQASGWHSAASANAANYKLAWTNAQGIELPKGEGEGDDYVPGKFLYFIESLVMPQSIEANVEKLNIKYRIVSGTVEQKYDYVLKFDDGENRVFENFQDRNNYTVFLTVRPNVITFDASSVVWTDKNANSNIVPPVVQP